MNDDRSLWRYSLDCGRHGVVTGLFVSSEEEIDEAIGKRAYFGEILGKHSEVWDDLEKDRFERVDLDSETVEKVADVLGDTWSGYNPLECLQDDESDEDEEEEDD